MPTFDAEVRASGRGSHAVVVPKGIADALDTRRVRVTIGTESFEATLGAYGGRTFLGLRKPVLTALGVVAGDQVHVTLEAAPPADASEPADAAPLTCPELDAALATDDALGAAWRQLPDGHREEYGRWISAAEPETRPLRIARLRHRLLPT